MRTRPAYIEPGKQWIDTGYGGGVSTPGDDDAEPWPEEELNEYAHVPPPGR